MPLNRLQRHPLGLVRVNEAIALEMSEETPRVLAHGLEILQATVPTVKDDGAVANRD